MLSIQTQELSVNLMYNTDGDYSSLECVLILGEDALSNPLVTRHVHQSEWLVLCGDAILAAVLLDRILCSREITAVQLHVINQYTA